MKHFAPTFILSVFISLFLSTPVLANEASTPQLHPSPFGMMGFQYSHVYQEADAFDRAAEYMDLYKQSGARWDRRDFWWGLAEPEKGVWDWTYFDRAMADFENHNVNLLAILCYGSAWSGVAPATDEEIEEYGEYVFQMVNRYKGWVKHWEIWNEPNILPFWAPKPDWPTYARLLQVAYKRAKEADPDCVILGGATAGADHLFLRTMYEYGAKDSFDVFSYHTYGNNPTAEGQLFEINRLREVMVEFDDEKPIWLTETGIFTGPAGLSEELQAERIAKSEIRWVAYGVERTFQLTLKDWTDDPNTEDATSFRGITHKDGTPKPSFYAFRTLNNLLGDKKFVGSPALHPELNCYFFQSRDQNCLVLWAEEGKEVAVEFNLGVASVMSYNLTGDASLLNEPDHVYTMTVGQAPVYLEGVGEEIAFAAGWKTETDPKVVAAGDKVSWQASFKDALGTIDEIEIKLHNSAVLDFGEATEKAPVDQVYNLSRPLAVNAIAPIGGNIYTYQVTGKTNQGVIGPVTLYGNVQVENPIELSFAPFDHLSLPVGMIQLEIHNRSQRDVSGDFKLEWSGVFDSVGPEGILLKAGEVQTLPVMIDGNRAESGEIYEAVASLKVMDAVTTAGVVFRPLKAPYLESPVVIDGDLSDWSGYTKNITQSMMTEVDFNPALNGGEADIAMSGWVAWDSEAVYLAIEVKDDVLCWPKDTVVWEWDSLQVGFDGMNDAGPKDAYTKNDYEIEIARLKDGSNLIFAGHYPPGFIDSVVKDETDLAIVVDEEQGTIIYEMRIPQPVIPSIKMREGSVFGLNMIHNDNDENRMYGREGWLELSPGLGWGKEPVQFRDVILWGGPVDDR